MNGFLNLIYTKDKFTAGLRYEAYQNVLQGFDPGYAGEGFSGDVSGDVNSNGHDG